MHSWLCVRHSADLHFLKAGRLKNNPPSGVITEQVAILILLFKQSILIQRKTLIKSAQEIADQVGCGPILAGSRPGSKSTVT